MKTAKPSLILERFPYEDALQHFSLLVSDGSRAAWNEFYLEPESLRELGAQLKRFPEMPMAKISFECGEKTDERYSGYIGLHFYLRDAAGHAAVKVDSITRGNDLVASRIEFAFETEVAAINNLGAALSAFADSDSDVIESDL